MPATFDCISTHKAMQSQFISMIVRKPFMDKIEKYTKDDVNACFQYQKLCEKNESLGKSKPINVDEKTKSLLDIIKHIKPGMRAMNCSDESRGRVRNLAFALSKRLGNFNVFATLSPDTAGTYTIGINTFNITETGCKLQLPNILPNRAQRKRFAASDPFQSALYAKRLNEVFIDVILGWDQILKGPKKEGGLFGLIRGYIYGAETQQSGDVHFHYVISIVGFPKTSIQMTELLKSPEFSKKLMNYIEKVISIHVPFMPENETNSCPQPSCNGLLMSENIAGEAYRLRKQHESSKPAVTSSCLECSTKYGYKDVLMKRLLKFAETCKVDMNPLLIDRFRCLPPEFNNMAELSPQNLVYLGLNILDIQMHYETHTKSCFQKPSAAAMRCDGHSLKNA